MKTAQLERMLPSDVNAERSILGAILLDSLILDEAARIVVPNDFFHNHHRKIYQCMLAMAEDQTAIDLITLSGALQTAGDLEAVGGAAYISQLIDGVPHISNIAFYAKIVKEKALLRGLVHAANAMQEQALDAEEDSLTIIERAEAAIAVLGQGAVQSDLSPLADVIGGNWKRLEEVLTQKRAVSGLSCGYAQLDALLCGLHPGNVIILAARPSIGKTALALNIAENVVARGLNVAFFSLEMTREEILQRLIASVTKRDLRKLRAGGMDREDWKRLVGDLADLGKLPLFIDDANPTTVVEIAAKARYLQRRKGLSLVVVDYLQLVGASRSKYANRNEEVGATSRALKAMAKQLRCPVIVLSQLTRASEREERRPQLSDLRESGAIEQDADVVLFIHRPKAFAVDALPADRNATEMVIAKQRNGPTEVVKFAFLAPYTRFEELDPELHYD